MCGAPESAAPAGRSVFKTLRKICFLSLILVSTGFAHSVGPDHLFPKMASKFGCIFDGRDFLKITNKTLKNYVFAGLELGLGLQNGGPEWRWLLPWTPTGADKCLPLLFPLPPRPCNKYSFRFDRVVPSSSTNRRHKACENMTLGQIVSAQGAGTNRENTGPWDKSFQHKAQAQIV